LISIFLEFLDAMKSFWIVASSSFVVTQGGLLGGGNRAAEIIARLNAVSVASGSSHATTRPATTKSSTSKTEASRDYLASTLRRSMASVQREMSGAGKQYLAGRTRTRRLTGAGENTESTINYGVRFHEQLISKQSSVLVRLLCVLPGLGELHSCSTNRQSRYHWSSRGSLTKHLQMGPFRSRLGIWQ
jgi:hypothetical protein